MSRRALQAAIVVAGTLLCGAGGAAFSEEGDDPYDEVVAEFRKRVLVSHVDRSAAAVALLDPANPRSLPELLEALKINHWYVRGAVMEALATVPQGALRSELRLHLITHDSKWVREGIAYAMSIAPEEGDGDALVGAMDDADWRVRRATARALGEIISRDGVARLVTALEDEEDLRVLVWVRKTLREIVGRDLGRDPEHWREWWERHKDRPEWTKHGDEVKREEFAGVPLETVTIEAPATSEADRKRRAARPDLFVLNPFGYDHGYFRPYLDEAAAFLRIHYVTLPTVEELTGKSGFGRPLPRYPVDRLAKALDGLRKEKQKDRIVILGAGPAGWIAEKYALEYPKHTAGLVVVNGWLDSRSYAQAVKRLAGSGTSAERHTARLLLGLEEATGTREERRAIRRVWLTHSLTERRDSEAYRLWTSSRREHGSAIVPDLAFDRRVKVNTPTLFYFPDGTPLSGGSEAEKRRIRDSFKKPPPVLAVMRESRGLTHVEDPEEFLRVLQGFLRHAGILGR